MARRIGPTIGLSGEAEYRKQIKDITADMSVLCAQMDKTSAVFADNEKSSEALTKQNEILSQKNDVLSKAVEATKKQLEEVANAKGKDSAAYKKLEKDLLKFETQILKNNKAIKDNSKALEENEEELDDNAKKISFWSQEAQNQFNAAKDVINNVSDALKKVVVGMYEFATAAGAEVEELQKMANEAGVTTQRMQELQYASDALNVDVQAITDSMHDLSEKAMDALNDSGGETARIFKELGVYVLDINGHVKDSNTLWEETIASLGNVHNETERTAMAMKLFGGNASKLNAIMGQDGVKSLRAYSEEARNAGVVMDDATRNALQKLNDEQEKAEKQISALKARLAAELAPELTSLIKTGAALLETFEPLITKGLQWLLQNLRPIAVGVTAVAAGFAALQIISALMPLMTLMNQALMTTNTTLTITNATMAMNPVVWVVAGITAAVAALIVAIVSWTAETENASKAIEDGAESMEESVNKVNEVAEKFNEEMKSLAEDMDWVGLESKFKAKFSIIGANSAEALKTGLESGLKDWETRLMKIVSGVEEKINTLMTQENKSVYAGHTASQTNSNSFDVPRGYKGAPLDANTSNQPVEVNIMVDKTKLATIIYDPLKRVARQKGEA